MAYSDTGKNKKRLDLRNSTPKISISSGPVNKSGHQDRFLGVLVTTSSFHIHNPLDRRDSANKTKSSYAGVVDESKMIGLAALSWCLCTASEAGEERGEGEARDEVVRSILHNLEESSNSDLQATATLCFGCVSLAIQQQVWRFSKTKELSI
jgi:hypothetical protein